MVISLARGLYQKYVSWLIGLTKKRSRQGLYEFLAEEYATIPKEARVLSVGAGGEVNRLLKASTGAMNIQLTSIDVDVARQPDIVADICETPLPANRVISVTDTKPSREVDCVGQDFCSSTY